MDKPKTIKSRHNQHLQNNLAMKKVVLALATVAVVAFFSLNFTSCKKKCKCNIAGVEFEYDIDELNEKYNVDIKNCTELSMPGVKCD